MPPPKAKTGTGLRLERGVPVESLLKWRPPAAVVEHCHELLGLNPDGTFRFDDGLYRSPEGTDARTANRPGQ